MTRLDHTEPRAIPDSPNRPPMPPPDVMPVREPHLPEHPDPIKEPPSHQPPVSTKAR